MHRDMAVQIFMLDKYDKSIHSTLRQAAKNGFVFPQFYGDYYVNCAVNMACGWGKLPQGWWKPEQGILLGNEHLSDYLISKGINSLDKFTRHIQHIEADFWGKRFPEYTTWKTRWWNVYQKYGYIDMLTGFRCYGQMSRNDCINYPVQGAAFHVNLKSFTLLDEVMRRENWDTRLIGQIHDSIILDVNPDELSHVMETARRVTCEEVPKLWDWIIVPLDVEMELTDVDHSWEAKHKI